MQKSYSVFVTIAILLRRIALCTTAQYEQILNFKLKTNIQSIEETKAHQQAKTE